MVSSELRLNLTVVIPTYNRAQHAERLARELKGLNSEIIVVDDCSKPPVVVDGARVVRNSQRLGVGESRNIGYKHVKSGWVLFLDDDLVPSPGLASFLQNLLPKLNDKEVVGFRIVGFNTVGSKRVRAETSDTKNARFRILNILFGVDISPRSGPSRFTPAPAVLFQSDFFTSLGGYDIASYKGNAFRISSDLQWRARKMGGRITYVENPFFEHLNIPGGHKKGHSGNDVYFMRNQTIFAIRSGGRASLVMIAGFAIYMLVKGFRLSTLVRGISQGLSVALGA